MSEEDKRVQNDKCVNGGCDNDSPTTTVDDEMFLFSSESVGEGHPGKTFLQFFLIYIYIHELVHGLPCSTLQLFFFLNF